MSFLVFLALGSNEGDRLEHLRYALEELVRCSVQVEGKSKIYESKSVGSGGEGDFLNAVLRGRTSLSALELLATCQEIEKRAGRDKPAFEGAKRVGSRALDIDILLFGDESCATPALELPHPRALERPFVLRPLLDVLDLSGIITTDLEW